MLFVLSCKPNDIDDKFYNFIMCMGKLASCFDGNENLQGSDNQALSQDQPQAKAKPEEQKNWRFQMKPDMIMPSNIN